MVDLVRMGLSVVMDFAISWPNVRTSNRVLTAKHASMVNALLILNADPTDPVLLALIASTKSVNRALNAMKTGHVHRDSSAPIRCVSSYPTATMIADATMGLFVFLGIVYRWVNVGQVDPVKTG